MGILQPIKTLHSCIQATLPAVFGDELSYLEQLAKITDKLNEIIINYNELIGYYNTLDGLLEQIQKKLSDLENEVTEFKEEIETEFNRLQAELQTQINTELSEFKLQLQKQQDNFEAKINQQINTAIKNMQDVINLQIEAMWLEINNNKTEIYNYLNAKLDEFQQMIPEWQNVSVINPVNGKLEPLQTVINSLYQLMRLEALTAQEYDSLKLTAEHYDKYIVNSIPRGLTAFEYDFYGKRYLHYHPQLNMLHPYFGNKVFYKKVISFNTGLLRESGSLTGSEYDGLNITTQAYDTKQLTANQYDWLANRNLP